MKSFGLAALLVVGAGSATGYVVVPSPLRDVFLGIALGSALWLIFNLRGGLARAAPAGRPLPVSDPQVGWAHVRREIDRSRRHERNFAVLRVPLALRGADGRELDGFRDGSDAPQAAAQLASMLRAVDDVWTDQGDVYALLPESDRNSARTLLARLGDAPLPVSIAHATVSVFPEDGVTMGALIEALDPRALRHGIGRSGLTAQPGGELVVAAVASADDMRALGSS